MALSGFGGRRICHIARSRYCPGWVKLGHTGTGSGEDGLAGTEGRQQPFRVGQIWRVECLGEPAGDGRQKFAGFLVSSLITPEAGEAGAGAQLKQPGALPFRDNLMASKKPAAAPAVSPIMSIKSPRNRNVSACSHLLSGRFGELLCSIAYASAACGSPAIRWASAQSVRICGTKSVPLARTSANPADMTGIPRSG